MRAHELLLEYDRSREQQRIEAIPAFQQRFKQDRDFSLEQLEQADPTPAKIYVPRLATWWLQGTNLEDLVSRGADALEKYQTLKQRNQLNPEHRDIGRFKKFADFETAMQSYAVAEPESAEDRGRYREIFRDNELVIVELLDETAAKFWGRNTQWCTAARNNNRFSSYHSRGPLFVITPRQPIRPGERYQYWFDKNYQNAIQFMDEYDNFVDPMTLRFYAKLQRVFSRINRHIMWIANPTPAEEQEAVETDGNLIRYVKNPSEELQLIAIENKPSSIRYLPDPSERVQLAAVGQNGATIHYIKNPSEKVKITAVNNYGGAIQYINHPSKLVQFTAVTKEPSAIKHITDPSEELQLAAVQKNGEAIGYINYPSEAVQLAAVKQSGYAIGDIRNPSERVKIAAVAHDGWAIRWIKNPSEDVQLAAVRQNISSIAFIKSPTDRVWALHDELKGRR